MKRKTLLDNFEELPNKRYKCLVCGQGDLSRSVVYAKHQSCVETGQPSAAARGRARASGQPAVDAAPQDQPPSQQEKAPDESGSDEDAASDDDHDDQLDSGSDGDDFEQHGANGELFLHLQLQERQLQLADDSDDSESESSAASSDGDQHELELDELNIQLEELDEEDEGAASGPHPWAAVAHLPVSPHVQLTVREAAFRHIEDLHHGVPVNTVEKSVRDNSRMFGGSASPDNPLNRYPPSLFICRKVLGIDSLDAYERHLCPCGCDYQYPNQRRPEWKEHARLRRCGEDCPLCRCPKCGAWRFIELDGGIIEPANVYYFLLDAIDQLYLDPVWVQYAEAGHTDSRYVRSPEGLRVIEVLKQQAYDLSKVRAAPDAATHVSQLLLHSWLEHPWPHRSFTRDCTHAAVPVNPHDLAAIRACMCISLCRLRSLVFVVHHDFSSLTDVQVLFIEIASDGAEMKTNKPHSTQFWFVRANAVHDSFKSKHRNVQILMIKPGPRAPVSFAPAWHLILRQLKAWSPLEGAAACLTCCTAQCCHPQLFTMHSPCDLAAGGGTCVPKPRRVLVAFVLAAEHACTRTPPRCCHTARCVYSWCSELSAGMSACRTWLARAQGAAAGRRRRGSCAVRAGVHTPGARRHHRRLRHARAHHAVGGPGGSLSRWLVHVRAQAAGRHRRWLQGQGGATLPARRTGARM